MTVENPRDDNVLEMPASEKEKEEQFDEVRHRAELTEDYMLATCKMADALVDLLRMIKPVVVSYLRTSCPPVFHGAAEGVDEIIEELPDLSIYDQEDDDGEEFGKS